MTEVGLETLQNWRLTEAEIDGFCHLTIACSKKLFFHSSRVSESFGNLSETLSLITNMKTKKYLSTKEAAELLSVDPRTILHRIQRNEIIAHKSGKTWKIEYDSIKDQEEPVSER